MAIVHAAPEITQIDPFRDFFTVATRLDVAGGWPRYLTATRLTGGPAALALGRDCDHGVAVAGSVKVGIDFPQSREFKTFAQFADCEGTERDQVFVRLNLPAVLEGEHQMGDVFVAQTIGYLPGVEHQASPPPAG